MTQSNIQITDSTVSSFLDMQDVDPNQTNKLDREFLFAVRGVEQRLFAFSDKHNGYGVFEDNVKSTEIARVLKEVLRKDYFELGDLENVENITMA